MTTIEHIIIRIRNELIRSISGIDSWFDKDDALLNHRSGPHSKSICELLADVMHANRHLLVMIDRARISSDQPALVDIPMEDYCLRTQHLHDAALQRKLMFAATSTNKSVSLEDIRFEIREQLDRCLIHLELLYAGTPHSVMTLIRVDNVGELDIYHSIYFLAVNARRYLGELDELMNHYNQTTENV